MGADGSGMAGGRENFDVSRDGRLSRQTFALRRFFGRRVVAEDVDDLVQEVFVAIQARLDNQGKQPTGTGDPIENWERYLFTVARHELAHYYRRRANRAEQSDTAFPERADESPDAERLILGKEELDHILHALGQLSERTRSIFMMHRFEDYTYSAIARAVGISVKGVEHHISAALKALAIASGRF